jgi:hypothetical protein
MSKQCEPPFWPEARHGFSPVRPRHGPACTVPGPARRDRRAVPGREARHAGLARARHGANSRHGLGPVKNEAQPT